MKDLSLHFSFFWIDTTTNPFQDSLLNHQFFPAIHPQSLFWFNSVFRTQNLREIAEHRNRAMERERERKRERKRERERERDRERENKRRIERWKEREKNRFEREMGEKYFVLEKEEERFLMEMGKNYFVLEKQRERFAREMGENYSVLEKQRERFKRQRERFERVMRRKYSLLDKQRERSKRQRERSKRQRERFEREVGENYSVLEKLNHLMISKACNLTADQIDHIDFFYNRLTFLATILKDLEEKQQQLNHEAKNLPMQIYSVISKTRQLIRFFDVQVPRQRDINNGDSFFDILIGTNIMEEIKTIEEKVVQFYDQINQIQLLQIFNDGVHSSMSMENRTMVDEEITVGFDDEALTIKRLLAGGRKQLQMISIVGMPGLGKTTLARKLYNDPYITHYFHIRAWTYASQLPRKTDMLLDILRSLYVDEIENMTNEKLGDKLYKQLKGKRYLIVIDDIWDIGAWVDLKMYFPNDNNGSRVLFTSRLKELAMHASPDCHPHCLRFLKEEESWELLQRKVFQNESCPPELIEIGKQIMKKCEGLPLAIVVMAGLLAKDNKAQVWWQELAQSVSSYIVSDPNQYLDTLALSYNHLPRHLRPCFLYLGAFPVDQQIPVQKLICLWIAEGFVQKIGQRSLEEVAEDYLMDLIQRSLVIVAQKRFDGRIKACRMHDLLRDLCFKKFNKIIGCDNSFGDMCSLICWTFKLLRVFKRCHNNAFFPTELTQLVNLRYLVILPCNVWKIPKLRHLYAKGRANYGASLCSEDAVMDHNHPSILENLRTITRLNPYGSIQDLLARTPFLTKLGICGHLSSDSGNIMFPNLECLRHLETLKIENKFLFPSNFREVKFPTNVKRLTLIYTHIEWEDISILGMMLPNLELLKLENAAWGQQWATTDGGFPRLKFLKLKFLNVKQWITCSSHFPSLQHISLEVCPNLKEIPSSLGDILTLQLIEVTYCHFSVEESVRKIKEDQESIGNNWLKVLIRKFPCGAFESDEDCLAMASLPCSESNRNGVFKGVIRENVPIRD
ncbi:unnamed protein product [Camellia sinensis]